MNKQTIEEGDYDILDVLSFLIFAYLGDPDSYAGWSFYTPVRATQARQVKG